MQTVDPPSMWRTGFSATQLIYFTGAIGSLAALAPERRTTRDKYPVQSFAEHTFVRHWTEKFKVFAYVLSWSALLRRGWLTSFGAGP